MSKGNDDHNHLYKHHIIDNDKFFFTVWLHIYYKIYIYFNKHHTFYS